MGWNGIVKPEADVSDALMLSVEYTVARANYEKLLTPESLKQLHQARDRLLAVSAL